MREGSALYLRTGLLLALLTTGCLHINEPNRDVYMLGNAKYEECVGEGESKICREYSVSSQWSAVLGGVIAVLFRWL